MALINIAPIEETSSESLVDQITSRLEEAIVCGHLAPGTKIKEMALAQALGVSRGPLRESMRRLEGRRLIERTPNVGARVAALSRRELYETLVAREALEGMACRLAAQRMSDEEIADLEKLLDEHSKHENIVEGIGYYQEREDFDFHFRIIRACGNESIIRMLCDELYDTLRIYRYKSSTLNGRAKHSLAEHRHIVAAIASRHPEGAELAMREHLRRARIFIASSSEDESIEP